MSNALALVNSGMLCGRSKAISAIAFAFESRKSDSSRTEPEPQVGSESEGSDQFLRGKGDLVRSLPP
ncbi:MAG: hypothetical protein RM368_14645 [Nostoc sp. DedSLP03]|uniref:hypothetical protein n=1 Tax=Nostoc sp. DedSLP03 TaxID=3075400 RepID=UPI002AD38271|nr:hypothetical protein [Nostoc sp. DedSLP03]MDZ7966193.1 hypothetical protein [Nostoc sp. DedSLP03]